MRYFFSVLQHRSPRCARSLRNFESLVSPQCSALLDKEAKEDFVDEIKEEYDEVRDEHYDTLKVRILIVNFSCGEYLVNCLEVRMVLDKTETMSSRE